MIISLKHGIQNSLDESYIVRASSGGHLCQRITCAVHDGPDLLFGYLVGCVADFVVEGREGAGGGGDVGVEVFLGDVFGERVFT